VAIRESGNVSSITDNAAGVYTVNFTTAMPDANYAVSWNRGRSGATTVSDLDSRVYLDIGSLATTSARVFSTGPKGTADTTTNGIGKDVDQCFVAIFR
jgi:hypothetical protein